MYPTDNRRMLPQLVYNFGVGMALVTGLPLWIASLAQHKRRATVSERLGLLRKNPAGRLRGPGKPIWVHALSVGEVQSAEPLVRVLRDTQAAPIVFSASTHSGHGTAIRIFSGVVDRIIYFPFDFPFSVQHVIAAVDPQLVIVVETDIWPNFLFELQRRHIPAALVNARLSSRSLRGYRMVRWLLRPAMQTFSTICVQSRAEAERFKRLGCPAQRIAVTGNIKFDQPITENPLALGTVVRRDLHLSIENIVVVAGSTHAGEEEIILRVFAGLRQHHPKLRLIIAPRHPQRARAVADVAQQLGLPHSFLDRLDSGAASASSHILIVNTLGLLRTLYAAADIAFVGGSLIPEGGHNPLEPAALAKPVLFGPFMNSCAETARQLETQGGAQCVRDVEDMARIIEKLLGDPSLRRSMGDRAQSVLKINSGAVKRTLKAIDLIIR